VSEPDRLQLLDVGTGNRVDKVELRLGSGVGPPIAVQPGGRRLALGGADGVPRLYDVRTRSTRELPPSNEAITSLAFSPNGTLLATTSFDGTLQLLDAVSGRSLGVFYAATGTLWSVDFSSDGRFILALGDDSAVRVFACEECGSEDDLRLAAKRLVPRDLTPAERAAYEGPADD
jgi:WD40 repeat protein